ncbi:MAG: HdeD family acid-resistance protein [Bacteroidales bacterium]
MESKLRHYRLTLMINGIIALLFGLFALFVPETATKSIAIYFGIVLIVIGIVGIVAAVRNMKMDKPYMSSMISSIVSLLVGILILVYTQQSLQVFVIIIGIWAVILGIMQLIITLNLLEGKRKTMLLINSMITILFGLILFFNPFTSAVALVFIVGILAVIFGGILLYFAFSLQSIEEEL